MRQVAKVGLLTAVATGSVLASTAGYAYAAGSEAHGGAANSPGAGSGNSVQAPVDLPVNACGNTVDIIGLLNPAFGNHCANGTPAGSGHDGSGHDGSGSAASGSSAHGGASNSPGVASGNSVQAPVSAPVDACGNSVNVVGLGNPAFGNDCGNHAVVQPQPPGDECHPSGDNCPPPGGDNCPPPGGSNNPPPPVQTPPGSTTPPSGDNGGQPPAGGGTTTPGTTGSGDRTGTPTGTIPVQQTGLTTVATPVAAQAAAPAHSQLAFTGAAGLELIAPAGALLLLGGGVLYRRSRAMAR